MGVEDMEALNPKDIFIEVFSDAWPDCRMRITHIPTAISVEAVSFNEGKLKEYLMEKLRISLPMERTDPPKLPEGRR